eukprot:11172244-Lingulodinium_polyedra.AAC.1
MGSGQPGLAAPLLEPKAPWPDPKAGGSPPAVTDPGVASATSAGSQAGEAASWPPSSTSGRRAKRRRS